MPASDRGRRRRRGVVAAAVVVAGVLFVPVTCVESSEDGGERCQSVVGLTLPGGEALVSIVTVSLITAVVVAVFARAGRG